MLLKDLFTTLHQGELKTLALSGSNEGGILEADYIRVIPHINQGLTELFKRFHLNRKEVIIEQSEGIATYFLDSKYAESNTASTEPIKYIKDSSDPFLDNVLVIETIDGLLNSDGEAVLFNDLSLEEKATLIKYNAIKVDNVITGNLFTVGYLKGNNHVPTLDVDIELQEVDVPPSMLTPLVHYVAHRVFAGTDMTESNNQLMLYEQACQTITMYGYENVDNTQYEQFYNNGWV